MEQGDLLDSMFDVDREVVTVEQLKQKARLLDEKALEKYKVIDACRDEFNEKMALLVGDVQKVEDEVKEFKKESVLFLADRDQVFRSAAAIGPLLNEKMKVELVNIFLSSFMKLKSKTTVVFDPKVTKVEYDMSDGFHNVFGSYAVVVASWGFGIRRNINAKRVETFDDVRYLYGNRVEIEKGLRAAKLEGYADRFRDFCAALPDICFFLKDGVFVRAEVEKEFIATNGRTGVVKGYVFKQSGYFMDKNKYPAQLSLVVAERDGSWSMVNIGGNYSDARRFLPMLTMSDELAIAAKKAIAYGEYFKRERAGSFAAELQAKFGRFILARDL